MRETDESNDLYQILNESEVELFSWLITCQSENDFQNYLSIRFQSHDKEIKGAILINTSVQPSKLFKTKFVRF